MTETTKIVLAVLGVFAAGFIMVGVSKDEPSNAQKEAASTLRNYVSIQTMASEKCPQAIKKETGEQVFFPSETKSDKETYVTFIWVGENTKTNHHQLFRGGESIVFGENGLRQAQASSWIAR